MESLGLTDQIMYALIDADIKGLICTATLQCLELVILLSIFRSTEFVSCHLFTNSKQRAIGRFKKENNLLKGLLRSE